MIDPGASATTSIPQSGSGIDVAQMVQQVLSSYQSNLQELAKKASMPIPGGHTGQMPLSMQQPLGQVGSYNRIPTQGIVGRGNARAAGIGNSVIGAIHAIATVKTEM